MGARRRRATRWVACGTSAALRTTRSALTLGSNVDTEPQVIANLFEKLRTSKRLSFPSSGTKLSAPDYHGVYVIYAHDGIVMHVGRTVRGKEGLFQRLNDHLRGKSSFTKATFNRVGAQLRGAYSYSYLEVADPRTRCLLESYAVGSLCPKHLGHGAKAA
jgi:hypothetical protein